MSGLTVSCQVAALGPSVVNKQEIYEVIYKELIKEVEEEEVVGIQLYPAGWPRKLQITVTNNDLKNKLLVEGLDIFGKHIDFKDENSTVLKVVLKDAPVEWSDQTIEGFMEEYGEIVRIEREMVIVDGRKTNWTTGTRFVYMSSLTTPIPTKLEVTVGNLSFSLAAWYRGQQTEPRHIPNCIRCGSQTHHVRECPHRDKVCYQCKEPNHSQRDCPNNDGTKVSDDVLVFFGSKSVLNNWNKEHPFTIKGTTYSCMEQYIISEKCLFFGDTDNARYVMQETEPREMRKAGDYVSNYDHQLWLEICRDIVTEGVRSKFSSNEHAKAFLLNTGRRVIGEATKNTKWGIGVHISDEKVMDTTKWDGENMMGQILMKVREDIQLDCAKEIMKDIDSVLVSDKSTDSTSNKTEHKVIPIDDNAPKNTDQPTSKQWALVIGASNIRDLQLEDDNMPVRVLLDAVGGTKLNDVATRVEYCQLDSTSVSVVVLHVGTCEWKSDAGEVTPGELVYTHYVEALNAISTKYGHAELVLSSIPPRAPIGKNRFRVNNINKQIDVLNEKLHKLSEAEENIMYINNDTGMKNDNGPDKDLYRDTVHLNDKGRMILADNIKSAVREGFAKNALRVEWDVAPSN